IGHYAYRWRFPVRNGTLCSLDSYYCDNWNTVSSRFDVEGSAEVRQLLGHPISPLLQPTGDMATVLDEPTTNRDVPSGPLLGTNTPSISPSARPRLLKGDVDGDGIEDVLVAYVGKAGYLTRFFKGRPSAGLQAGEWQVMDRSRPSMRGPDGDSESLQATMTLTDQDNDQRLELAAVVPEGSGQKLVVLGWNQQQKMERYSEQTFADGGHCGDLQSADIDGDGDLDLMCFGEFPQDGITVFASQASQSDLMEAVHNGLGGRVVVDYQAPAHIQGAIVPAATECTRQNPLASCGQANHAYRPLTTQVTEYSGRTRARADGTMEEEVKTTQYGYHNGRYLYGADPRDLGFEWMASWSGETGEKVITTYYHDLPFEGMPAKVVTYNGAGMPIHETIYGTKQADGTILGNGYAAETTIVGVKDVRALHQEERTYEGRANGEAALYTTITDNMYDDHGNLTRSTVCQDGDCVRTDVRLAAANDTAWTFGKVLETRTAKTNGLVLGCERLTYATSTANNRHLWAVEKKENLVCADAERCQWRFETPTGRNTLCEVASGSTASLVKAFQYRQYNDFGQMTRSNNVYNRREIEVDYDAVFGNEWKTRQFVYTGKNNLGADESWSAYSARRGSGIAAYETRKEYNARGQLWKTIGMNGEVTEIPADGYDALGRVVKVLSPTSSKLQPDGSTVSVTRRQETRYVNFGDPNAQHVENTVFGKIGSETEQSRWTREYSDGVGRVYKTEHEGDGRVIETLFEKEYRDHKLVTRASEPHVSGASGVWTETLFDHQSRPEQVVKKLPAGDKTLKRYAYEGRTVTVANAKEQEDVYTFNAKGLTESVTDAAHQVTRYEYDPAYRVKRVALANGQEIIFGYDGLGRVTRGIDNVSGMTWTNAPASATYAVDSVGRVTRNSGLIPGAVAYTYNADGTLFRTVDAKGNRVSYYYDGLQRLTAKVVQRGTGGQWQYAYEYDGNHTAPNARPASTVNAKGRLTKVTDPSGFTWLEYDALGQVAKKTTKVKDTGSLFYGPAVERYGYDPLQGMTNVHLPDGTVMSYVFSAKENNLTEVKYQGHSVATFDGHNVLGQPLHKTLRSNPGTVTTYTYTPEHVVDTMRAVNPQGWDIFNKKYHNDAVFNVTKIEDLANEERNEDYTYDSLNRLATSQRNDPDEEDGITDEQEYGYDAIGNITFKGGVYDQRDEASNVTYGTDVQYEDGLLKWVGSGASASGSASTTRSTSASASGYFSKLVSQLTGVVTRETEDQRRVRRYNEIVAAGQHKYVTAFDTAGNVVKRRSTDGKKWEYIWDGEGRLLEIWDDGTARRKVAEYVYNYAGERVKELVYLAGVRDPVRTFVLGKHYQVKKQGTTQSASVVQIMAPGGGVLAMKSVGTLPSSVSATDVEQRNDQQLWGSNVKGSPRDRWYFFVADHLGSTSQVLKGFATLAPNQSGEGEWLGDRKYTPWGEERIDRSGSRGANLTDVGYTGQRRDEISGINYYGARYYDPMIGRFLSPDTVHDGFNRYAYVHNNPIKFVDPTGHASKAVAFLKGFGNRALEYINSSTYEADRVVYEASSPGMREQMIQPPSAPQTALQQAGVESINPMSHVLASWSAMQNSSGEESGAHAYDLFAKGLQTLMIAIPGAKAVCAKPGAAPVAEVEATPNAASPSPSFTSPGRGSSPSGITIRGVSPAALQRLEAAEAQFRAQGNIRAADMAKRYRLNLKADLEMDPTDAQAYQALKQYRWTNPAPGSTPRSPAPPPPPGRSGMGEAPISSDFAIDIVDDISVLKD
ncbi:MAG: RHS repeat-associated core domain-containing protein, partial [Deltaproteobacteria bacterium]|nr:RHS repeat-associated core domain-containing protein [Deltaproteobacteria bacterium]